MILTEMKPWRNRGINYTGNAWFREIDSAAGDSAGSKLTGKGLNMEKSKRLVFRIFFIFTVIFLIFIFSDIVYWYFY